MERWRRNNRRIMTAFHSRQSDCGRRVQQMANASVFNFTPQIVPPICTVKHAKHDKSGATIFKSQCKRTVVCKCFYRVHALPLSKVRFSRLANGSPANRPNPAIHSRNVREPSGKKSGEVSRSILHNFQKIADNGQCNAAAFPREQLARQLAIWRATIRQRQCQSPRNRHCNIPRIILHDDPSKFWHQVFNHNAHQL